MPGSLQGGGDGCRPILSNKKTMEISNKFSRGEELANAWSHLLGTLLAVAGFVLMVVFSTRFGGTIDVVSTIVFGLTLTFLYFSSTMTHILPMGRLKDFFFNTDRIAIYLLIAGTYTPICLSGIGGPLGWVGFGLEWGIAALGIGMILFKPGDFNSGVNRFYVISYAAMGWLVLIAIVPAIQTLPLMGWIWIFIGGICYSVGIIFYNTIKFPYHHLVWHLLVLAGSISHFFAVFFHIIPR